jgi:hypothetical protein
MKKMLLASAASVLAMAQLATAAPILTGNLTNPEWQPNNPAVTSRGTSPVPVLLTETPPNSGIFTLTLTPAQHGLDPAAQPDGNDPVGMYKFKCADSVIGYSGPYHTPAGPNDLALFVDAAVAASTITFTLETVPRNDGFVPDVGSGDTPTGFVYTSAWRTWVDANASQLRVVGNFQSELGGNDWDQANGPVMSDTLGGDPANDGIYKYSMTGLPSGSYDFKILVKPINDPVPYDPSFTNRGLAKAFGSSLSFSVIAPTDTITIILDANTGRTKVTNNNPQANPGPPFFATSSAWSTALDGTTQLTDQNNGLFTRVFTVPNPGDYQVRVKQYVGRDFSATGDYPFTTTVAGQQVLVVFDRNNYTDGYLPATDFVVVLDSATRTSLNSWEYAQVIIGIDGPGGADCDDFGFGGDFDPNFPAFQAQDNGVFPDTTAGDQIFSRSITPTANDDPNPQRKFVARRTGKGDTGYKVQAGGALNGLTIDGNNEDIPIPAYTAGTPVTWKADLVTGRTGISTSGPLADPVRGIYFTPNSSVLDWTMF